MSRTTYIIYTPLFLPQSGMPKYQKSNDESINNVTRKNLKTVLNKRDSRENGDLVELLLDRGASDIVLNLAFFAEEGTKIDNL